MAVCKCSIPRAPCASATGLAMAATLALAGEAFAQTAERVALPGFDMDRTEVTIGQFARYAEASGIITRAEREGGGFEFEGGWQRRPGWSWRSPDGVTPRSDRLPAVHLTQG